ncbi:Hsp20/alpha crystallin family protein [Spirochaeta dissipatitropha]
MNLVTWNSPLRALQDWERDLDQLFDTLMLDRAEQERGIHPRLDVIEKDNAYTVYIDLPGVKQKDVDVSLTSNVLTISGKRHSETKSKEDGVSKETAASFERSLTLPEGIDAEKVEAKMENGVLELHIPKSAAAVARKIPILASESE